MRVRPYILAGGRSSRMGRDKAMLLLGGVTLLGRAVGKLRAVPSLKDTAGLVVVTVVGERASLEGADRAIADRYLGCGPLGGMEAALRDLQDVSERRTGAEWAFFLPVDMPFLPPELIEALLQEWSEAAGQGARMCHVVADGTPQPLVSMMHRSVLPFLVEALTAGEFKVTPVLQSAAEVLASSKTGGIGYGQSVLHVTPVGLDETDFPAEVGISAVREEPLKRLWFSNLNDEDEFRQAETFAALLGST